MPEDTARRLAEIRAFVERCADQMEVRHLLAFIDAQQATIDALTAEQDRVRSGDTALLIVRAVWHTVRATEADDLAIDTFRVAMAAVRALLDNSPSPVEPVVRQHGNLDTGAATVFGKDT